MNMQPSESQNIEWKALWDDKYIKWICGFANAQGGRIYVGKDSSGQVVGLSNAQRLMEDLPNKIRDQLGLMPQVNLLQEGEKNYIEIVVDKSSVAISWKGSYYLRSGSTTQELQGNALNNFLLRRMGITWERVIEGSATLDDIDEDSVGQFKKDALKAGRLPPLSDLSTEEVLRKLRLLTDEGITRASLVLFGKDPGKFYPNLFVKIGRFVKSNTDIRFQEVCEGNLITILKDTMEQLEKKFLIKPIRFAGIQRIEELEYPVAALREMLLNALVHRDYLGSMTQMKVYDNRLILWNAGGLPETLSVEQLFRTHSSLPRNPLIAEVCYKAGYIDTWGRGVEKIVQACREAGLPSPKISEEFGGITVELQKSSEKSSEKGSEKGSDKILKMLKNDPFISAKKIAEKMGISSRAVEKHIDDLKNQKRIRRVGTERGGRWEIINGCLAKIRILGNTRRKLYIYNRQNGEVYSCRDDYDAIKRELLPKIPSERLREYFPHSGDATRYDKDAATLWLMQESSEKQIFCETLFRGQGIWREGQDTLILNTGKHLITNEGEEMDIRQQNFENVYLSKGDSKLRLEKPLEQTKVRELYNAIKKLNFEDELAPEIIIGWLTNAFVGAIQEVRPAIWLMGPSKCGKTWFLDSVIRKMVGAHCFEYFDAPTWAKLIRGIDRGMMPCIIEDEGLSSKTKFKAVLPVLRSSWEGNRYTTALMARPGTADETDRYTFGGPFLFCTTSAIAGSTDNNAEVDKSNRRRWYEVRMKPADLSKKEFEALDKRIKTLITPEYRNAFAMRALMHCGKMGRWFCRKDGDRERFQLINVGRIMLGEKPMTEQEYMKVI